MYSGARVHPDHSFDSRRCARGPRARRASGAFNELRYGVVGVTRGEMVTAISGDTRGVDALRKLHAVVDATFVAKYTSPRVHLRHMKTRALDMIEQALNETGAFSS